MMTTQTLLSHILTCLFILLEIQEGKYACGNLIKMTTVPLITGKLMLEIHGRSKPKKQRSKRLLSILMVIRFIA